MKDWFIILGLAGLLWLSFVGGSFYFGRRYERQLWTTKVGDEMETLCQQCWKIGTKKGLDTCSDVLNNVDDGGRR